MRYFIYLPLILLFSCGRQPDNTARLQNEIDSLQNKLAHTYRPGLGEYMAGIQVHHAKLWYAGNAQNWALAQFELDEIKEATDGIREFCQDRPEISSLHMIDGPVDSLANTVKNKDLPNFKNSFIALTATCNNCHRATKHEFNVIKLPDSPPFSNQEFKAQ